MCLLISDPKLFQSDHLWWLQHWPHRFQWAWQFRLNPASRRICLYQAVNEPTRITSNTASTISILFYYQTATLWGPVKCSLPWEALHDHNFVLTSVKLLSRARLLPPRRCVWSTSKITWLLQEMSSPNSLLPHQLMTLMLFGGSGVPPSWRHWWSSLYLVDLSQSNLTPHGLTTRFYGKSQGVNITTECWNVLLARTGYRERQIPPK